MKLLFAFIGLLAILILARAKRVLTEWETCRKTDRIEMQYRWVNMGDTLDTREMRAFFSVHAEPDDILRQFYDNNRVNLWAAGSSYCRIYGYNGDEWVQHTIFDIPKPFTKQDLVVRYRLICSSDSLRIVMEPAPEYLPAIKGIERMHDYAGEWVLIPGAEGITRIEFHSVSFVPPRFPRFIQDPILRNILLRSFESLAELSEGD